MAYLIDIPPSRLVGCVFCAERLDSTGVTSYRRVHGWAKMRKKGGLNSLTYPTFKDVYACSECIDKLKAGIPVGQMSLFTFED